MKLKLFTDQKLLSKIAKLHYSDYLNQESSCNPSNFIEIDISKISKSLNTSENIIFGRLYYHLNNKYSYEKTGGSHVLFNAANKSVNFPYLLSLLSDFTSKKNKDLIAIVLSILALAISLLGIFSPNT